MAPTSGGPRRAELIAALSLAIDLGLGQPMEHMLRSALIATRLADRMGLGPEQQAVVYYSNLVAWIGCHADSHELAQLFGDDIAFRADTYAVDMTGLSFLRLLMNHVGRGLPHAERSLRAAVFLFTARRQMSDLIRSHCGSASALAAHIGLDPQVGSMLAFTFERWDGAGLPAGVRGDAIPIEMHIVHLADVVEVHLRAGGPATAVAVARARRGTQFCPRVVQPQCTDRLMWQRRVSLCGIGRYVSVVDRPTSRVGLLHWLFRVEAGQLSGALDDDRPSPTEGRVEQVVPGCFPRPVGW